MNTHRTKFPCGFFIAGQSGQVETFRQGLASQLAPEVTAPKDDHTATHLSTIKTGLHVVNVAPLCIDRHDQDGYMPSVSTMTNPSEPYRVLFVCWGNICRSPAAECVFRTLVENEGLAERITCDSAGTIDQHAGNPPDLRMREAAARRNIVVDGASRMAMAPDFDRFDLLLTMDDFNLSELRALAPDAEHARNIRPFCEYLTEHHEREVPDPYFGGPMGFDLVLDLLEDGCGNLLSSIRKQLAI